MDMRYAIEQCPPYWEMPDTAYFEAKQLYNTIREYAEQLKRFNNQLHSLQLLPVPSRDTIKSIGKMKKLLEKEMDILEVKLAALLQQWQPEQVKSVGSVKGIGKRDTAMLIVFTQGFRYTRSCRLPFFSTV